jgi:hypothetical protein
MAAVRLSVGCAFLVGSVTMGFDRGRGFHVTNGVTVADLQPGVLLSGVRPGLVTVVAATPLGESVNLVFRDGAGEYGDRLLYPADLAALVIQAPQSRWSFDADGAEFRLAAEAQRIRMAGIHDPMLAVTTSDIRPLPHQIKAVYEELLPQTPLRFLLADDPGAGKTIMAGLYAKELMLRDDLQRMLIIAPGRAGRTVARRALHEVRARHRVVDPGPGRFRQRRQPVHRPPPDVDRSAARVRHEPPSAGRSATWLPGRPRHAEAGDVARRACPNRAHTVAGLAASATHRRPLSRKPAPGQAGC